MKIPYKSKTEIAIYNRREVNGHLEPSSHHKYVLFTKNAIITIMIIVLPACPTMLGAGVGET